MNNLLLIIFLKIDKNQFLIESLQIVTFKDILKTLSVNKEHKNVNDNKLNVH